MKKIVLTLCAFGAAAVASPSMAADKPPVYEGGSAPCSADYVNSGIACQGYYDKNLLQGDVGTSTPDDIKAILNTLLGNPGAALNPLPGTTPTDFTSAYHAGTYTALNFGTILGSVEGQAKGDASFDFGALNLSGLTLFGAHFGNNDDTSLQSVTAFWLLDLGSTPVHEVTISSAAGVSNARVYATGVRGAVPEPATWAMMLLGFGAIGMASRRRRAQLLPQIA